MSKTKEPPFADWQVSLATPDIPPLVIRASRLHAAMGWVFLEDTYGGALFTAPAAAVLYVKRMEPGEDVPAVDRPGAVEVPEPAAPKPVEIIDLEPKQARPGRRGK